MSEDRTGPTVEDPMLILLVIQGALRSLVEHKLLDPNKAFLVEQGFDPEGKPELMTALSLTNGDSKLFHFSVESLQ